MEPNICSGELIVISEKENYKIGDIVTYIDEENFMITHRILEIDSKKFISKGDANNIKDESCEINKIQGKVIYHSKVLGFFILYLLKPICVLYATGIIIFEVMKNKRTGEKENEQENKT